MQDGAWPGRSLQQAVALGALLLVHGLEELDGLVVEELPEVLEGDVLAALDAHLLHDLRHAVLALHRLQAGSREAVRSQNALELTQTIILTVD